MPHPDGATPSAAPKGQACCYWVERPGIYAGAFAYSSRPLILRFMCLACKRADHLMIKIVSAMASTRARQTSATTIRAQLLLLLRLLLELLLELLLPEPENMLPTFDSACGITRMDPQMLYSVAPEL